MQTTHKKTKIKDFFYLKREKQNKNIANPYLKKKNLTIFGEIK